MKRILDIDKIIEDREKEKQKSNYWQRIKNDPVKLGHYRRKQYVKIFVPCTKISNRFFIMLF